MAQQKHDLPQFFFVRASFQLTIYLFIIFYLEKLDYFEGLIINLVREECVLQRNEVAILLGIISLSFCISFSLSFWAFCSEQSNIYISPIPAHLNL